MPLVFKQTDFMQETWYSLGLLTRPKTLHTVGVLQQIKFVADSSSANTYTGLFKSGAQYGIARYSVGVDYDKYAWGEKSNMLPGIAFKFWRTRVSSGNIHAMHSFKGNTTPNFFQHNFTNHLATTLDYGFQMVATMFAKASKYALTLGLRDFATVDEAGDSVGTPVIPFRVEFEP